MTLKTSLIITGDSKVAVGAVDALKDSVDRLNATAQANAPATAQMDAAVGAIADTAKDAAGAIGTMDGAIGAIGASSGAATNKAAALGNTLGQVGKDTSLLDGALSSISGAIGDTMADAMGLDSAFKDMGGSSREASELAGALEGELGKLAQGAVASATAQKGIAAASGVASTAMAGLGVTATAVEAILTGGLSLALTVVIGFLGGFASELLTAGGEAEVAAAKIDKFTSSLDNLRRAQSSVTAVDLGNAEVKLRQLEGWAASPENDPYAPQGGNRAGDIARALRRQELQKEIEDTRAIVLSGRMRMAIQERAAATEALTQTETRATASVRTLSSARMASSAIERAAGESQVDILAEQQRPIREMLDDQQRQIALGTLQVQGRVAEADALKLTNALMDKMGVETEAQLATELAKRQISGDQVEALYGNLEVLREQTRELEKQQQAQQVFIGALGDMRENVRLTIESLRSDGPKALGDFAKRSLDVFDRLFSQVAVEKLFGGLFDDLEEQITGGDGTSKAGKKLAEAVDRAAKDMKKTSGDIVELGKAAAKATGMINGTSPAAATLPAGWIIGDDGKAFDPSDTNITVTASEKNPLKELKSGFKEGFEGFFDEMKGDLKDVFTDIFGDRGVFPATLGKTLGRLTAGAQTGAMAGSIVTGILGIKGSSTGGAIGGAIGTAIAGPIGSIVGGALGSIAGGLLKKTQSGAANITNVDGKATLSGNNAGFQRAAVGAAEDVQDGLASIAEQLGGAIGGFNVTIGQRHGDWRVRSGAGSLKIAKGATEFDDDEAGAKAYAMQLAISQGAITGLSAAVSKALKSSDDLETALTEALKVQEIELLIGGIGAQIASQFKTLETQAKERLRIASEYGFDVVAIEKKNAEDRVALSERLLEEQVGSLQRLVDEMTSGSLFEGSAIEQRNAILKEIDQAKVDLAAGKDGAGDKLATLLQNLNTVSEDAFGSTAQYAADRAMIQDEARAAIAAANAQIREAANKTASDPALTTTNQSLDENNDQNAQIISLLQTMIDRGQIVATSGTLDAASLARTS